MRYFEIVDERKRRRSRPYGMLFFEEKTRTFHITLSPQLDPALIPESLAAYVQKGNGELLPEESLMWVKERIPSPDDPNISHILAANGLREYDALGLLLSNDGNFKKDHLMLREVFPVEDTVVTGGTPLRRSRKQGVQYAYVEMQPESVEELKKQLGKQLHSARKAANVSQVELCRKSGVPQATISNIERGLANPTLETLAALARSLGLTMSVSLEQKDQQSTKTDIQ